MNYSTSSHEIYPELLDDLLNLEYLLVFNNHGISLTSITGYNNNVKRIKASKTN